MDRVRVVSVAKTPALLILLLNSTNKVHIALIDLYGNAFPPKTSLLPRASPRVHFVRILCNFHVRLVLSAGVENAQGEYKESSSCGPMIAGMGIRCMQRQEPGGGVRVSETNTAKYNVRLLRSYKASS